MSTTKKEEDNWMQMGVHCKTQSGWQYWQVQSKASCERIYAKVQVDYQEMFDPISKINTICILISLAVNRDQFLRQFDVKNAFLNGDLE